MIEIMCDVCNGAMAADEIKTLTEYSRELGYKLLDDGEIDPDTFQDYLVYRCVDCMALKKYSLKEVEFQMRRALASKALTFRAATNNSYLSKKGISEDSEIFYCGKCAGIDEKTRDGNCLISISKHCRIFRGLNT